MFSNRQAWRRVTPPQRRSTDEEYAASLHSVRSSYDSWFLGERWWRAHHSAGDLSPLGPPRRARNLSSSNDLIGAARSKAKKVGFCDTVRVVLIPKAGAQDRDLWWDRSTFIQNARDVLKEKKEKKLKKQLDEAAGKDASAAGKDASAAEAAREAPGTAGKGWAPGLQSPRPGPPKAQAPVLKAHKPLRVSCAQQCGPASPDIMDRAAEGEKSSRRSA